MGSRVQSTVGCFPELFFLQFSVSQLLVDLRKQFIINFVFPIWPVLLVLIIIITCSGEKLNNTFTQVMENSFTYTHTGRRE